MQGNFKPMSSMKKTAHYLMLSAILIAFTTTSCKKYEQGPDFSILPKKERLANNWKMETYMEDGVEKTTTFNNLFQNALFTIESDGDYTLTYKPLGITNYSETGTWRFVNSKEDFETNPTSGVGSVAVHHILKLKDKELWYVDTENGVKKEYHLIP